MSQPQISILIVEDNEASARQLGLLLEKEGYAVTRCSGGCEALQLVKRRPFDLALLDIILKDISGLDVLTALRADFHATALPVIMTTGMDQSVDMIKALSLGANDYVTKPLDVPVLLARIHTQLSLKQNVAAVGRLENSLAQRNAELEVVNERMRQDLVAAARIQAAYLPAKRCAVHGVSSAWLFRPCDELAGDMLNVVPLGAENLGFYVLDVSGHGVAAALLAVTLSRTMSPTMLVRQRPGRKPRIVPPAAILRELSVRFPWDANTEQFFTLFYGVLNVRTGTLRYASAGHPHPILLPVSGAPMLLNGNGQLGGLDTCVYEEHELFVQRGDRLFMFTDGACDVRNPDQEIFGRQRLQGVLERQRHVSLRKAVVREGLAMDRWRAGVPLCDDVSLLGIELAPEPAAIRDRVWRTRFHVSRSRVPCE